MRNKTIVFWRPGCRRRPRCQSSLLSDFEASTMHSKNQERKLTDNLFLLKVFTKKVNSLQARSKKTKQAYKQNKWTSIRPKFCKKFNSQLQYSYCIWLQASLTTLSLWWNHAKRKKKKTYFVILELYSYIRILTTPETNSWIQRNQN